MSQSAISTAESALMIHRAAAEVGAAVGLVPERLDLVRVAADEGALQFPDGLGNGVSRYSRVASPTPCRPSSVRTFTNTQFVR